MTKLMSDYEREFIFREAMEASTAIFGTDPAYFGDEGEEEVSRQIQISCEARGKSFNDFIKSLEKNLQENAQLGSLGDNHVVPYEIYKYNNPLKRSDKVKVKRSVLKIPVLGVAKDKEFLDVYNSLDPSEIRDHLKYIIDTELEKELHRDMKLLNNRSAGEESSLEIVGDYDERNLEDFKYHVYSFIRHYDEVKRKEERKHLVTITKVVYEEWEVDAEDESDAKIVFEHGGGERVKSNILGDKEITVGKVKNLK